MTETKFDREAIKALTGGALAREVLELIEDNRDRWYQGSWRHDVNWEGGFVQPCEKGAPDTYELYVEDPLDPSCKTSFCFAGWVAAIDGVKWAKGDQESIGKPGLCDCETLCCTDHRHQISVPHYARQRLEIASYESDKLFDADNDIDDLRRMVSDLEAYGEIIEDEDDDDYSDDDDD